MQAVRFARAGDRGQGRRNDSESLNCALVAAENLNPGAGTERSEEMDCVGVALVVATAGVGRGLLGARLRLRCPAVRG